MRAVVSVAALVIGMAARVELAGAQVDRIDRLKQAVAATPSDPALWVKLAEVFIEEQRFSDAPNAYQGAIKLDAQAAGAQARAGKAPSPGRRAEARRAPQIRPCTTTR